MVQRIPLNPVILTTQHTLDGDRADVTQVVNPLQQHRFNNLPVLLSLLLHRLLRMEALLQLFRVLERISQ